MGDVRELLTDLTLEQRAELELQLMRKRTVHAKAVIPRREEFSPCPLSFGQQRLWFLNQLAPDSPFYNVAMAFRLTGMLNAEALQQALDTIVSRHEVLRTTFKTIDGQPLQIIAKDRSATMAVVDLSGLPTAERETEVQRVFKHEAQRPFDLSRDLMLRATSLCFSPRDYVLIFVWHHIASDRWSAGVLFHELSVLYTAFSRGKPAPLTELPVQYADYAVWQRERLQGEVLEQLLSYWKKQLEGIPGVLNLPTDHPRPTVQSYRGARQSIELTKELSDELKALSYKEGVTVFVLPKDLTKQLKDLARKQGVTLFMTLLATFKVLLYQYTRQTDLVIGSPIAGRNRPEIEGLVGFFVNTLVLRTDLSGNPTFCEVLGRVRGVCLGAYAHQELPYQKLVESLRPKRGTNRGSLAQVFFAFQNVPRHPLRMTGLTVTPVRTDLAEAKSALTLFMWEAEECLAGSLNYAVDLFNAANIGRMIEHFQTLLNAVVADSERRLLDLPPFIEQSRSELLEAIHWATEQSWHLETDTTAGREQGEI